MKSALATVLVSCGLILAAGAQTRQKPRKSLLESDPNVVYLSQVFEKPIELTVVRETPVFSDKNGKNRLGFLTANQKVPLEAMTEKAYRVRGRGTNGELAGWTSPKAFTAKDPDFATALRKLYERQIAVQKLIDNKEAAIGMTSVEVGRALGKPTKTTTRKTPAGESGSWEFIDYETVKHYTTEIDPRTGMAYRRFAYATQEEKSKTKVDFTDGVVSSLETTEQREGGNVRIVVPPVIFLW